MGKGCRGKGLEIIIEQNHHPHQASQILSSRYEPCSRPNPQKAPVQKRGWSLLAMKGLLSATEVGQAAYKSKSEEAKLCSVTNVFLPDTSASCAFCSGWIAQWLNPRLKAWKKIILSGMCHQSAVAEVSSLCNQIRSSEHPSTLLGVLSYYVKMSCP